MSRTRQTRIERLWYWRYVIVAYVILLGFSTGVRMKLGHHARRGPDHQVIKLKVVDHGRAGSREVEVAYKEFVPPGVEHPPVVLMLHGSPIQSFDLTRLALELSRTCRVILPDLPGFGASQRYVPDYSIRAHAVYARELMDALGISNAHFVAYSQGGGEALILAHTDPQRVQSLVLVSSIGAQEFELLGNYELNHAIHGIQLGFLWLLQQGVPHMGWLDSMMLNVPYALNFYQTDQRPLREYLRRYEGPVLIVHGRDDILVPLAAAEEHHRISPQSEIEVLKGGHILVFRDVPEVARVVAPFIDRAERGEAATRATADPARIEAAHKPFDPAAVPKVMGIALFILVSLIVLSTLVSEDMACVGAGLMAANGVISYQSAALAAFVGIFVGDLMLFGAGKYIGRPALRHRPFRWFFKEQDIQNSTRWFSEKGPAAVLFSRFIPGSRLPTYFAAGMLHKSAWQFIAMFFIAGTIWAPLLVWIAMKIGGPLLLWLETYKAYTLITALVAVLLLWALFEIVIPLFSFRGRRLLLSAWRRKTRWEFWPPWLFYPPVLAYVAWLACRHRSLTVFTAANPAIPDGGFIGESKHAILLGLKGADEFIVKSALVPGGMPADLKLATVRDFLATRALDFPIVAKPDVGQRGRGVAILRSLDDVDRYFSKARPDSVVQEFAPGFEFGIFYYRYPDRDRGRIFSITEKRFPIIAGDGKHNLETLILSDDRAVCMAPFYLARLRDQLSRVPAEGEKIALVEIGNHCRGAVFYDGSWILTPELEAAIERISRGYEGFYFGRYDVRAASLDDLRAGRNFKIIELNGVTSEATHIYHPGSSLFAAYRTLMRQWQIAFEIGVRNRAGGAVTTPAGRLLRDMLTYEPAPEAD